MNLDLKGKYALVGGSTQGIGLAAARELASLGASVILLARDESRLSACCNELPGPGAHGYIAADFGEPEVLSQRVNEFVAVHPVHILVNNTGGPPGGPALGASIEEYEKAFRHHLVCNQLLTQAVVPGMKASGYGRIINVISTSVKQPLQNLGVSNTIRGAVANWAKTMASELGPFGITVNNVLPGATDTARLRSIIAARSAKTGESQERIFSEMAAEVPLGRIAAPEEIAAAIAFLASAAASYVNGINLPVDGGRTNSL
jgi:3-oxoacyl-[acyl-carrier protein] reductase